MKLETATIGGGCFWCTEAQFLLLDGVVTVQSGYSGGTIKNPSYREVCMGITGHAEVVLHVRVRRLRVVQELLGQL